MNIFYSEGEHRNHKSIFKTFYILIILCFSIVGDTMGCDDLFFSPISLSVLVFLILGKCPTEEDREDMISVPPGAREIEIFPGAPPGARISYLLRP